MHPKMDTFSEEVWSHVCSVFLISCAFLLIVNEIVVWISMQKKRKQEDKQNKDRWATLTRNRLRHVQLIKFLARVLLKWIQKNYSTHITEIECLNGDVKRFVYIPGLTNVADVYWRLRSEFANFEVTLDLTHDRQKLKLDETNLNEIGDILIEECTEIIASAAIPVTETRLTTLNPTEIDLVKKGGLWYDAYVKRLWLLHTFIQSSDALKNVFDVDWKSARLWLNKWQGWIRLSDDLKCESLNMKISVKVYDLEGYKNVTSIVVLQEPSRYYCRINRECHVLCRCRRGKCVVYGTYMFGLEGKIFTKKPMLCHTDPISSSDRYNDPLNDFKFLESFFEKVFLILYKMEPET